MQKVRTRKGGGRPLKNFLHHISIEHDWNSEYKTHPKFSEKHHCAVPGVFALRSFDEGGLVLLLSLGHQAHTALRTHTRLLLFYLLMHRAGVDSFRICM